MIVISVIAAEKNVNNNKVVRVETQSQPQPHDTSGSGLQCVSRCDDTYMHVTHATSCSGDAYAHIYIYAHMHTFPRCTNMAYIGRRIPAAATN